MNTQRLLIGYDGTEEARHAVAVAAGLTGGRHALVVTVWDVLVPGEATSPLAAGIATMPRTGRLSPERAALFTAREGADLARACGLLPEFDTKQGSGVTGIARALSDAADSWGADVIVVGRRDMSRLREIVLGSVSDAVVREATRPVLVVPANAEASTG